MVRLQTEVRDENNEERKRRGNGANGGREGAAERWTICLLPSCFSVRPLHCSTPCRSWECADFSTSSLLPQRRQIISTKTSQHNSHRPTIAPAVLCVCLLSGALVGAALLLSTSRCRTVLRPDSSFAAGALVWKSRVFLTHLMMLQRNERAGERQEYPTMHWDSEWTTITTSFHNAAASWPYSYSASTEAAESRSKRNLSNLLKNISWLHLVTTARVMKPAIVWWTKSPFFFRF